MSRKSKRGAARNGDSDPNPARARASLDDGSDAPQTVADRISLIYDDMDCGTWNPSTSKERAQYWASKFGLSVSRIGDYSTAAGAALAKKRALEQGTPEHREKRSDFIVRARQRGDHAFESGHHNASAKFMEIEHVVGGYAPLPPTPQALIVQNFGNVPEYQVFKRRVVSAAKRLDADGRSILQRAMAGEFDAEDGNAG